MKSALKLSNWGFDLLDKSKRFEFVALLFLRIFLAPIFIYAGLNKLSHFSDTVAWFGSAEWGLGLPFPWLMAFLATSAEVVGGFAILFGFATRLFAIPLMITMIVAATTAHWGNGWHALPDPTLTVPWEWRTDLIDDAQVRKEAAVSILKEHGHYSWLTEAGSITVLKNGIEFSATYFLMLLVLFFSGAGRYLSIDYWIALKFRNREVN